MKPIHVWGHWGAPNPWKLCTILEELTLPYEIEFLELSAAKEESYLRTNPNGRLPAIRDPNTDLVLWESGAIILYLVEQYDHKERISYKSFPEKQLTQQWLIFQVSGQAPYFGQATWFARFHPEKVQSATDRYVNEIFRVTGVIEAALTQGSTGWLVGVKMTYADLAFVTWAKVGEGLLQELGKLEAFRAKFPRYLTWMRAMEKEESVKKINDRMNRGRIEHGLR